MPRAALFLLILVTWALGGCAKIRRLLDLEGGDAPRSRGERVAPAGPAMQGVPGTKCCWCVLKPGDRNSVQKYVGRESCEARSGKWPNATCRAVEIEEPACTLVRVAPGGGALSCQPNPLHYRENGARREIAVPDDFQLTCRGTELAEHAAFRGGGGEAAEEGTGAPAGGAGQTPPDEYCSCGRAPGDGATCQLVKVRNGITSVLAQAARPRDAVGCTGDVCLTLFKDEEWRPKCAGYVPGDP